MRSKNLIILSVLVLALGAFIVFVERHAPTTEERLERADRVFAELDENEVVGLRLRTGHGPVRLVRSGDDWRLVEPIDYPADDAAVRSLLRSIASLDADRSLSADEVAPADYGLDDPPLGVVLESSDGTSFELDIGNETPLGGKRAVRRGGGGDILLCSGAFVRDLDRGVDDWRSRDVIELFEDDLASLSVEHAGDVIDAVRSNGRWQLARPVPDLADPEQMRSLVSELNGLRISEFLDADSDPSVLGLDPPEYRIELTRAAGGDPVTLELAAPAGDESTIVCRRNGSEVFRVPGTIRARLAKAPVLWRSAKVWPFSSWEATRVEITGSGGAVLIDRVDGLWQLEDGGQANDAELRRRLNALADLEARDHDLMLPPTEVLGSVILVLEDDGSAEGLTYTFYAPLEPGGHAAVTVSTRANVMAVDASVVDTVVGDLEALKAAPKEVPLDELAPEHD